MTLLDENAASMIDQFGETVEIIPQAATTSDSSDDIWRSANEFDSGSSYEVKARTLRTPEALEQTGTGFSDEAESGVYFNEEEVSVGDKVIIGSKEWVVIDTAVSRVGYGVYRQIAGLASINQ